MDDDTGDGAVGLSEQAAAKISTTAASRLRPRPWRNTQLFYPDRIDARISADALSSLPQLAGLTAVSIEWSGFLVVRDTAVRRFATKSDDGSWLWIDERLIVDNGGIHPELNRVADVWLERGVHPIRVRNAQYGGEHAMQLGQAGGRGLFGAFGTPKGVPYVRVHEVPDVRARGVPCVRSLAEALRDRTFLLVALIGQNSCGISRFAREPKYATTGIDASSATAKYAVTRLVAIEIWQRQQ